MSYFLVWVGGMHLNGRPPVFKGTLRGTSEKKIRQLAQTLIAAAWVEPATPDEILFSINCGLLPPVFNPADHIIQMKNNESKKAP